jgi:thioredoxin reductase
MKTYDVIIIGGSYAGLSAALSLGRSLRKVLIIDSQQACNRFTPHSHNFLTQDGQAPETIAQLAREQVKKYDTIDFYNGRATQGFSSGNGFEISTQKGDLFAASKLIFASGIKDLLPQIKGMDACWGVSVIHCPYCHGYEVRSQATGILGNGDFAYEFAKMVHNLSKELSIFTNGPANFTPEQGEKLWEHGIKIIESPLKELVHQNGQLEEVLLENNISIPLKALYARLPFVQHCDIPITLGCDLTDQGYLQVSPMQQTSVEGIYACGDNASPLRSVANAVASGATAGAMINRELVNERF